MKLHGIEMIQGFPPEIIFNKTFTACLALTTENCYLYLEELFQNSFFNGLLFSGEFQLLRIMTTPIGFYNEGIRDEATLCIEHASSENNYSCRTLKVRTTTAIWQLSFESCVFIFVIGTKRARMFFQKFTTMSSNFIF